MKHVIDRNGIRLSYTEDFINRGKPNGLDDLDFNIIETELEPNENFVKNKWNGSSWIEGENIENINELKATDLTNRINKAFTLLRQRALASSIGKSISFGFEYIKEQSEQYTYKYEVAIGNIQDAFVNNMIDHEANDFGITSEQMRQLIIDRYLQGKGLFIGYTSMIERARTKALTMIEISDFDKAEQITLMMENVPTEMTLEDAQTLTNQMLEI